MKKRTGLLCLMIALAPACGDDPQATTGAGGSGAASSSSTSSSPTGGASLEAVCDAYCEALWATECAPTESTLEGCHSSCPFAQDDYTKELCRAEYQGAFTCVMDKGLTCDNGKLVVSPECSPALSAAGECVDTVHCSRYCDKAIADGCAEAGCYEACVKQELELGYQGTCGHEHKKLLMCQLQTGVVCDGGEPSVEGCEPDAIEVGSCISFDDPCGGFCWAAEALGCGAGCEADCKSKLDDPKCGSDYGYLLECALVSGFGDRLSCENGKPTPGSDCDDDTLAYQACKADM